MELEIKMFHNFKLGKRRCSVYPASLLIFCGVRWPDYNLNVFSRLLIMKKEHIVILLTYIHQPTPVPVIINKWLMRWRQLTVWENVILTLSDTSLCQSSPNIRSQLLCDIFTQWKNQTVPWRNKKGNLITWHLNEEISHFKYRQLCMDPRWCLRNRTGCFLEPHLIHRPYKAVIVRHFFHAVGSTNKLMKP